MRRSQSQTLITGVYRTGSEYLTQLLSLHPDLSATMYRVNVLRFVYDHFRPIRFPDVQRAALVSIAQRFEQRYGEVLPLEAILDELTRNAPVDSGTFYDVVMTMLYLTDGRSHWAEKNQLLWRQIPLFIDLMRNGRSILIIRDPRAVLASFKRYTTASSPAYLGAIFNCSDSMKWAKRLSATLGERFLVLRYEDIAERPQDEITRAWRFLGLEEPYPEIHRQSNGWKDAYGRPWFANSSFQSADASAQFDVKEAMMGWRRELSCAEVSLTEIVNGPLMPDFGYEPSLESPSWDDALRLFASDPTISSYFRTWLQFGDGIQAFPSNPLDPSTWESVTRNE